MNEIWQQIKSGQTGEGGSDDPDSRMDVERLSDRRGDKKAGTGSSGARLKLSKGGGTGMQQGPGGGAKGQGKQGFWPK